MYKVNIFKRVYVFYRDGFRNMEVGKTLWLIILIKLAIIFLILRVFFFRPELSRYDTDSEKAEHVIENLTKQP
ncbi:MAG: DUF4492 domain-containing protein [Bacteroidales bacterium]|nr:DUF4492 domain-containing protein [Bacteroidales bacterium]MBR6465118.1 DUF4492 domain-containing protein [Bacteroidales bacterium]